MGENSVFSLLPSLPLSFSFSAYERGVGEDQFSYQKLVLLLKHLLFFNSSKLNPGLNFSPVLVHI